MTQTGGARPGPAPNAKNLAGVRETQKRGVVRQARRASRSAAFGLRPGAGAAGFIGKRRAVSSIHAGNQQDPECVSLGRFSAPSRICLAAPARAPLSGIATPPGGNVRTRCSDPSPSTKAAAGLGTGHTAVSAPEVRAFAHPSGLSAPGFGETLRDEVVTGINATHRDGGKRPPITIGPEPLDHHAAPRQQPDQRRPRGLARTIITPCIGRSAVMALGTVGQFGGIDVGNAYLFAAATDGVAVVDGWRKTQDGGGKKDRHGRNPSAPSPSRQWPRSSPAGPASMPASLGGRRCDSADARPSE